MTQSAWSPVWVAGIKSEQGKEHPSPWQCWQAPRDLVSHQGHRCSSPESLWSDNGPSSLHGLHLWGVDLSTALVSLSCLAFKNFDYGAMLQVENSMEIENLTLVDNTVGLFTAVYVSSAPRCYIRNLQIVLRNSVIVATSSSFDCIQDRVKPHSANLTSPDRGSFQSQREFELVCCGRYSLRTKSVASGAMAQWGTATWFQASWNFKVRILGFQAM